MLFRLIGKVVGGLVLGLLVVVVVYVVLLFELVMVISCVLVNSEFVLGKLLVILFMVMVQEVCVDVVVIV